VGAGNRRNRPPGNTDHRQQDLGEFGDEAFALPPDKPLTVGSYMPGDPPAAYVDAVGVGAPLPDAPLFLADGWHVPCPLESAYMRAWAVLPAMLKELIGPPAGV
jgi:hypothetical protein